jgi:hypothetical protein
MDSQIGFNGLISNYFGLLGMIGWGGTFYTPKVGATQNYDSVNGQAQITWYPNPQGQLPTEGIKPAGLSSVALGYSRNFSPSYLGTFYQRDRVYANVAYFFGERFLLSLAGGLSHISRPPTFFPADPNAANANAIEQAQAEEENRVDATAFLEYRVLATFGINATFRFDSELNHRTYQTTPGGIFGDDLFFKRYQVYLGVRWFL